MRKIISLSSYLAFFGSGCFSVGLQEENNPFCHEMLAGFTEEIRRPLDQVEMCWRNLSTLDTDRYKAMGALIATGLLSVLLTVLKTAPQGYTTRTIVFSSI